MRSSHLLRNTVLATFFFLLVVLTLVVSAAQGTVLHAPVVPNPAFPAGNGAMGVGLVIVSAAVLVPVIVSTVNAVVVDRRIDRRKHVAAVTVAEPTRLPSPEDRNRPGEGRKAA
jgi:hypothetical protein